MLPTRYHSPDSVCCMVLSVLHIKYIDVLQAKEAMLKKFRHRYTYV